MKLYIIKSGTRIILKVRLFRKLEVSILYKADKIVVVSNFFKEYMLNKFLQKVPKIKEKLFVIPNRTTVKDLDMEYLLSKKKNNHIGVYSGSTAPWQNINELKVLIKTAININPKIEFKIITYEKAPFEISFKQEQDIYKKVQITEVSSEEVYENLIECNFGILIRENNLINNVSSPLKFGEYLAAGLPILISEGIGDTEIIINHYNAGVVIKGNDYETALKKMFNLLNDSDVYKRCIIAAKEKFNLIDSFIEYKNIYERLK